jgi:hypothetical protein
MEPVLLTWIGLILNAIDAVALTAALWQLLQLRRDTMALLHVLRRIDRKASEPGTRP